MTKMHLAATPPNEGARLLARWIGEEALGSLEVAGKALGIKPAQLQRMIDGDLLPGDELRQPLFFRAGIGRGVFVRPAACGWFDQPADAKAA